MNSANRDDEILKELRRLRQLEEQRQAREEAMADQGRYEAESRCSRSPNGAHSMDYNQSPTTGKTIGSCTYCGKVLDRG